MRFTVRKHLEQKGYALHDACPPEVKGIDVEGLGYWQYRPPYPKQSATFGWYQYKRDALLRAVALNDAIDTMRQAR